MKARFNTYRLEFKIPGGTSRGVLTHKDTWFLCIQDGDKWGMGECNMFRGLSADDRPDYEDKLAWVCEHIEGGQNALDVQLIEFPSIRFGLEQAFRSLNAADPMILFPSDFTTGRQQVAINGLIWMGDPASMQTQIEDKIKSGFKCIKVKIGALDFNLEMQLLQELRSMGGKDLEIRVDANGAFSPEEAPTKLERLAALDVHSIEQPIRQGQHKEMKALCKETILPIALDEELIGIFKQEQQQALLETIQPQFIILKPSLLGGFKICETWMQKAKDLGIDFWITSALESNIGLNAIAQWTAGLPISIPQGLGTGGLFNNNIDSPLMVQHAALSYSSSNDWDLETLHSLCL